MLTEKPSEIPNNSFETITDARDKRLQTRLGEIVRGKFEYYYSDLLQMKKFGLQIWINQRWEILLDGKEKWLDFVIAGYRIEWMRDNYTIPIWGTFRIYNGSDWSMNIEIIQPNEQPFIITISQKK